MPEIRRVLRPAGGVAIMRSLPLWEGPWSHEIGSLLADARPEHPAFEGLAAAALSEQGGFGPVQEIRVHSEQVTDRARMLAYLASFSWIGSLPAAEREDLLRRAGEVLDRHDMGEVTYRVAHLIWVARLRRADAG